MPVAKRCKDVPTNLIYQADLTRNRQNELPLADQPKHGPTYRPNKDNSVKNIPKALRKTLNDAWASEYNSVS